MTGEPNEPCTHDSPRALAFSDKGRAGTLSSQMYKDARAESLGDPMAVGGGIQFACPDCGEWSKTRAIPGECLHNSPAAFEVFRQARTTIGPKTARLEVGCPDCKELLAVSIGRGNEEGS